MDLKDIKELMRFFDKSGLGEFEWENDAGYIRLSKYGEQIAQITQPPASFTAQNTVTQPEQVKTPPAQPKIEGNVIESPMIGTFYIAASPGATPFINVGDIVEKGQTICIIEAMKIMNTIEAEYRCKILKIVAENGKPLEFGQPIVVVEPM